MKSSQILHCCLISFGNGQAVLPHSSLVESLPFATPLRMENAPPWVAGAMLWGVRTTPLVNLDALLNGTNYDSGAHSRIIVINSVGNNPKLRNFGILGTAAPRTIDLTHGDVTLDETVRSSRPDGVLTHVRVNGESAIIPNMSFIEQALGALIRRVAS